MPDFHVTYTFEATATDIITADTLEEAKAIIAARVEDEDFLPEPERVDRIDSHVAQLHPVIRNGRQIRTTYVLPTDQRVEPAQ